MIVTLLMVMAVVIAAVSAVFDYRTNRTLFRSLLIILSGVMVIGFLLQYDRPGSASERLILLTDGATNEDLTGISEAKIYSVESPEGLHSQDPNIRWLSSVELLAEVENAGQPVEIFGYGLREKLTDNFRWIDHLNDPGEGILINNAPQQVSTGSRFQISGRILSDSEIDSVSLYRDGDRIQRQAVTEQGAFSFTDRLQVQGPALYHIEALQEDTTLREPWHVRTVAPDLLNVAIMLYSPSFEVTHLAEWLGNGGQRLAIRTRLGEDRFRHDNINDPPVGSEDLEEDLLAFDLLILDAREVAELQGQILQQSVAEGLDILLLPPSDESDEAWLQTAELLSGQEINLTSLSRIEERQWTPAFIQNDRQDNLTPRLPLLNVSFGNLSEDAGIIGRYENRDPVVIQIRAGRGKVTSHLFYQTYSWKLRGDGSLYSDFWAGYLDRVITLESPFVAIAPQIPKLHERLTVTTSGDQLTVRNLSQNKISNIRLNKGAYHPGVNTGYVWPESSGWHVAESGDARRWFYVYDNDSEWSFSERYRRFQATRSEIQEQQLQQETEDGPVDDLITARWWLIGFLLIQAVLWAERKIVKG